jgi:hypothetical protein
LAQVGETVFGRGSPLFYVMQVLTAGILILAANTSFQDFPRLSSILARDRFMPSQFRNRGDRLVFSNGVVVLAGLACLLIFVYDAELTRLIQLYVVGVFTAFTLSQAGMVRRWQRVRGDGWRHRALVNAIGAVATGVVLAIVTVTKWRFGAWIVVTAMPLIVLFFLGIHHHYRRVGELLRVRRLSCAEHARTTFLLLVSDLGPAATEAIAYLRSIRADAVTPLFVGHPGDFEGATEAWRAAAPRLGELTLLPGADDHLVRTIRGYVRSLPRDPGGFVTVVIPELLTDRSWLQFVRHRAALLLKTSLLFEPGVVVTDVPTLPHGDTRRNDGAAALEHLRSVVLVPVSAVHDATVRAIVYAKSLQPAEIEAFCFVTDPEQVDEVVGGWHERDIDVPLVMVEAPFRDLLAPLLEEVRRHTAHGDTIVTVVLPEFIPARWWENLLHNQTAFSIKRLLLFEPGVVVTSVPFHLRAPEVGVGPS